MPSRRWIGKSLCAVAVLVALTTPSARAGASVWTSAGPSGTAIPPFDRVDAVAVDPVRPGTVYAATMRGDLFRTSDGGATWSRFSSTSLVNALAVGPTGIAYAASRFNSRDLRSTDGGRTWQQIQRPQPGNGLSIQADPNDASVAFMSTVGGSASGGDFLRSPDTGLTWISIRAGLGTGYVRAFAIDSFDSRRLFVLMGSGFFASDDSGASWRPVANGLPTAELNVLAVDFHVRGMIYAAGAAGIFRSRDSGLTFSRIGAGLPASWVRSVVVDPLVAGRLFAAIEGHGVHASIDGGDTWSSFGDGLRGDVGILAIHALGRSIHAGTTEGVFDYELTKTEAPLVLNSERPFRVRLTARDPRTGTVAGGHPIRQGDLFGYFSIPDLTSDSDDPEVVVKLIDSRETGGSVALFYSALTDLQYELTVTEDDTGDTRVYSNACGAHDLLSQGRAPDLSKRAEQAVGGRWATGGPPARDVQALALDPVNPQTLYAAARQGPTRSVYRSTNGGGTWVPTGLSRQVTALGAGPSGVVYAAGVNGIIFKTTDGGRNWREMGAPFGSNAVVFLRVDPRDPDIVYMGTQETITVGPVPPGGAVLRTLDGGLTWQSIQGYDPSSPTLGFGIVADLAVDPRRPATLHAVKASGYYRSDDRGLHWSRMFLPLTDATTLALDPRLEGVIYVGGPSGLFKSIDGGRSFSRIGIGLPLGTARESGLLVGWPSRLVVDPSRSSRIFAAIYGRGVFVSEDGGETWADFNAGLRHLAVAELAFNAEGKVLHAATLGGAFQNRFAAESDTLSLNSRNPFRLRLAVRDQRTGRTYAGLGTPLDDLFGYFTVPGLTTHADNAEVVVKVVDGRVVNGAFWFFHGALTDLEYTLTVTEQASGRVKTFTKPAGSACGSFDTSAFPSP